MDTASLRNQIKKQRAALSAAEISQAAHAMAQHLLASNEFQQAQRVAYYLAVNGEADPQPVIEKNEDRKKTFALPVVLNHGKVRLQFIRVDSSTQFETNQYGIPEPVHGPDKIMSPEQLDLIITPLVGFDGAGNRIGMGGGFYDRTFAFKRTGQSCKPLLIGYAYDFQRSKHIVPEPWDVPLDGIVTESGFTRF